MVQVTFHGAAETVTGSQHLIDMDGTQLLLDCGLFQGRRAESYERNRQPPYNAQQVQAVLLSHAHSDHAANCPHCSAWASPAKCTARPPQKISLASCCAIPPRSKFPTPNL